MEFCNHLYVNIMDIQSSAQSIISPALTRQGFLQPERILAECGVKKSDRVADFGSGHGYYAIALGELVGNEGKVFAIDIQKSALDVIRAQARADHLLQIEPIWADLEVPNGSKIKTGSLDFVVISDILYQSGQKEVILEEASRILKPMGRIAVIEWNEQKTLLGPPASLRIPRETAKTLAARVGFSYEREIDAGTHHYSLLFQKK